MPRIPCMNCEFWHCTVKDIRVDTMGECRVRSPQFASDNSKRGIWPETMTNEWCGDAQPYTLSDEDAEVLVAAMNGGQPNA